jgi:dolichyl-phosphate beta-glucosyltransferase
VPQDIYLSVIVPAYNEAERLPRTLERFNEYLSATGFTYEILVALDGLSDRTREVLREMRREIPHLKVIDRPVNHGKGLTVKEGMLRAAGRIRLFTDADNSTDIAHFENMQPFFDDGYELVIASRNSKDALNAEELIVQLLAVPGIWDTQCGFKAFRAEVAERIFSDSKIDGWGFDIEVLPLTCAFNYKIGIIPAHWVNDPRSHVRWFDYLRVLGDTFRVRANLRARKYNF